MTFMKTSLATATALSLFGAAHAWYPELTSCLSPFEPFVYVGCYDNGQTGQPEALSLRTDLDTQNMTVEICVAECKVSTAELDESQCSFPCTGNSSETCGGNTEVNIWMDPTFEPLGNQTTADYTYVGCWTDDSDQGRALFYSQDNLNATTMTTEACLASCLAGGYPFAGTEYASQCWCGVVIGNGTALAADQTTCNMPCNGDSDEICGGPALLSLYVATDLESLEPCGYVPPVSSSTPPTTTTTTTTISSTTSSITTTTTTSCTTTTTSSTKTTGNLLTWNIFDSQTTTPTTTTSTPVCTTTVVTPPSCEYKCGNWCSNPLPDWSDNSSCLMAVSNCEVQIASCFAEAGFPGALECLQFGEWCQSVGQYCGSSGCTSGQSCSKSGCTSSNPPSGGGKPTTITSTYPCPTTTTTTKATTTSTATCIPTPTAICTQPSDSQWGFGPGNPVGGINLPVVACNNIQNDWQGGNVFKLYTSQNSNNCPSYPRSGCSSACSAACETQYDQCINTYAQGCKSQPSRFGLSYSSATQACKAQYSECLSINKNVNGNGHCTSWDHNCGCAMPW
ncbi:WSC domain-containing protein [Xylariaceae sp. FL0255]|nr:WSC domain-containing protein [Xylariaceae sp. FL0255]